MFPDLQPESRECLALQSYLKQLDQPQVAFGVKQTRPRTLDDSHGKAHGTRSDSRTATVNSANEGGEVRPVVGRPLRGQKASWSGLL